MEDRYGTDVLAAGWRDRGVRTAAQVPVERDLVVEVAADGFCGAVVGVGAGVVELEDRHGRRRSFPLGPGFLIDGETVVLERPRAAPAASRRTASGSFAAPDARARTARASRILVEGRHDAELVEKVWGDDLRAEGVVVEYLEGVDRLDELLEAEPPAADRRYGVLVDHLVPRSKESRIADAVRAGRHGRFVHIVGHPYLDVWQCIRPSVLGLDTWPDVPRGIDVKVGLCRALGWPADTPTDRAMAWRRILGAVSSYRDLEPSFLGRVEELIDYVTAPDAAH